jgi:hypothetical protein
MEFFSEFPRILSRRYHEEASPKHQLLGSFLHHGLHLVPTPLPGPDISPLDHRHQLPSLVPHQPQVPPRTSPVSPPPTPRSPQISLLPLRHALATVAAHLVTGHRRIDWRRHLPTPWAMPPLSQQWAGPVLFAPAKGCPM